MATAAHIGAISVSLLHIHVRYILRPRTWISILTSCVLMGAVSG